MNRLRSRKLWVALSGVAVVVLNQALGVPAEKAEAIVQGVSVIVGAYLLGQGYADGKGS